jgi:two-component system, cell cycle response regulator
VPRPVVVCLGLCALLAVAFVARSLDGHGPGLLFLLAEGGPAALCLAGALTQPPRERSAWLLIAASAAFQTGGDAIWHFAYEGLVDAPSPNASDLLFLGSFACAVTGVLRLVHVRLGPLRTTLALDGVITGVSLAAILTVLFLGPVLADDSRSATGLAYIAADLVMVALVGVVIGLKGGRPGPAWTLLLGWVLLHVFVDGWFAYTQATGTYTPRWWLVANPLALLAAAAGACQAPRHRPRIVDTTMLIAVPGVLALADLAILLWAALGHAPALAAILAATALLVAAVRSAVTLVAYHRLLRATRRDALTDALTGLANRRRMVDDLAHAAALASDGVPATLLFFDLDGFKTYNDRLGHAAGDALLARLGAQLAAAVGEHGVAYRPGGDEFCVLLHATPVAVPALAAAARAALTDDASAIAIAPSGGAVAMPRETTDAQAALRLADVRMYEAKRARHAAALAA